jgi:16S rRNA (cytosine967-C5)-methyltransferase
MKPETDAVRAAAVDVLLRVFQAGAYLNHAVDSVLQRRELSQRGRRFLTQLAYGTVRYKLLCDYILGKIVRQPLEELPPPILAILRMGVFQSLFMNQVPFPAMVNTSVTLARVFGHVGTAKLANAVLRRVPKTLEQVEFPARESNAAHYLSIRYSMPEWLVEKWLEERGEARAEQLCETLNVEAPVTVRANTHRISAEDLVKELNEKGYVAGKQTVIPEEVTILEGPPPAQSKLFAQGLFLVQDAASMLPPHLVEPAGAKWILDACAAPGSKTTQMAQMAGPDCTVAAMDVHPGKLRLVGENAQRLGLENIVRVCGDAKVPPVRPAFDRVLVDAPCSGLGTLRRHPDLKWRANPETVKRLQSQQLALLRSGIQLCKNDGLVVYSVCTFTREETEEVARAVLETEQVRPEDGPDWLEKWKISEGQYRILPEIKGLDGFYLLRLRRLPR